MAENVVIEEESEYRFCSYVDAHVLRPDVDLNSVISIICEHGFRGLVIPHARVEKTFSILNKNMDDKNKKDFPKIIASVDPLGSESTDARVYAVIAAKEAGASEIEMPAPAHAIADTDISLIETDIKTIGRVSRDHNIPVKYILEPKLRKFKEKTLKFIAKVISDNEIAYISNELGFFASKESLADTTMWLRDVKKNTKRPIKAYISSPDDSDISTLIKAGINVIGIDWKSAVSSIHSYEEMVRKNNTTQDQPEE